MAKTITKKIEKVELIKVEKSYRHGVNPKYFYNFTFEGIEEPLLVINESEPLPAQMVGHKIKYKLDDDNLVTEFELL
jgi:hypothetical protein